MTTLVEINRVVVVCGEEKKRKGTQMRPQMLKKNIKIKIDVQKGMFKKKGLKYKLK